MSNVAVGHRLLGALQRIMDRDQAARAAIAESKARVQATETAYTEAKDEYDAVVESREIEIEKLLEERQAVASYLAAKDEDRDNEQMEALLQSIEQRESLLTPPTHATSPPTSSPSASNPTAKSVEPGAASRHSPHQVDPSSKAPVTRATKVPSGLTSIENVKHMDHLSACPMFVYDAPNEEWIELRCNICNSNADPGRRALYLGVNGTRKHVSRKHEIRVTDQDIMATCKYRVVPQAEIQRVIETGEAGMPYVDLVGIPRGRSGVAALVPALTSAAAASASSAGPSTAAQGEEPQEEEVFVRNFECIVKNSEGEWVELACKECGANSFVHNRQGKAFFSGADGLQRHILRVHPSATGAETPAAVMESCVVRVWTDEEVEDLGAEDENGPTVTRRFANATKSAAVPRAPAKRKAPMEDGKAGSAATAGEAGGERAAKRPLVDYPESDSD